MLYKVWCKQKSCLSWTTAYQWEWDTSLLAVRRLMFAKTQTLWAGCWVLQYYLQSTHAALLSVEGIYSVIDETQPNDIRQKEKNFMFSHSW